MNKSELNQEKIIEFYMETVLKNNQEPKSIYQFSKDNDFEEKDFYQYFSSFDTLKSKIFAQFFHHTITLLEKSEGYNSYNARNKLISFYFTFFELLTANRSYVVFALENKKNGFSNLKMLKELRSNFKAYIEELPLEFMNFDQENVEKIQRKTISETAWIQFLFTLKFWLNDTSPAFEKTDILIEKSVNSSFDLMNVAPLKSVVDLGKFLFKETFNPA